MVEGINGTELSYLPLPAVCQNPAGCVCVSVDPRAPVSLHWEKAISRNCRKTVNGMSGTKDRIQPFKCNCKSEAECHEVLTGPAYTFLGNIGCY